MRFHWLFASSVMFLLLAVGCSMTLRVPDDDDSASPDDDDTADDDDDTADDDDDTADDDDDDSAATGDDDDPSPPKVLGPGNSVLEGSWTISYWVDYQEQELACQQRYQWSGSALFNPNALGVSCPDCGGSVEVLNVVDVTETGDNACDVEVDLAGIDLGDILTNPDPENPYRDFIYPQGLVDAAAGLAANMDITIDGATSFDSVTSNEPDGLFLSHVGYLEDVEGRYLSAVNNGQGLGTIASPPPNSPTWMPFWRYYGELGNATLGAFSGHYVFGSLWVLSFNEPQAISQISFTGELDATYTAAGPPAP